MSKTVEYAAWLEMKRRCYNPKYHAFNYYGGRGIKVCERWLESFANFLEDMGYRPSPHYSLDRIDNNGDYEPANCRWATKSQQQSNRRAYGKTGFVGVYPHSLSPHRFRAEFTKDGKRIHLGTFESAEIAHQAVQEAKRNA